MVEITPSEATPKNQEDFKPFLFNEQILTETDTQDTTTLRSAREQESKKQPYQAAQDNTNHQSLSNN